MDEPILTWNKRAKGWITPSTPRPAPTAAPETNGKMNGAANGIHSPVVLPALPMFSPASIAALLHVYRSTVQYWIVNGKIETVVDNIGERYVLRAEFERFLREYLGRAEK